MNRLSCSCGTTSAQVNDGTHGFNQEVINAFGGATSFGYLPVLQGPALMKTRKGAAITHSNLEQFHKLLDTNKCTLALFECSLSKYGKATHEKTTIIFMKVIDRMNASWIVRGIMIQNPKQISFCHNISPHETFLTSDQNWEEGLKVVKALMSNQSLGNYPAKENEYTKNNFMLSVWAGKLPLLKDQSGRIYFVAKASEESKEGDQEDFLLDL